jgi:6-phosphofructokinase 1
MVQRGLLVLQAGGPTAVLNATLAGVIEQAQARGFHRIRGARWGFAGLLREDLADLTRLTRDDLERLAKTPGAALGTARDRLDEPSCLAALRILQRNRLEAVIAIGGNDTAASARALLTTASQTQLPLTLIHAPKTIDNDLPETDHTPGYPSAARFLALATRSLLIDSWSVQRQYAVTFLEVQGRNAGWLSAACALAAPEPLREHLVLLFPERPPESRETLIAELHAACHQRGWLLVVVPETLRDRQGQPIAGPTPRWVDPHGHPYPASPAEALAAALTDRTGRRARVVRPNALARSFLATPCPLDREEARAIGRIAVDWICRGQSGVMVAIDRLSDEPYRASYRPVGLEAVAGRERPLPDDFLAPDERSVTDAFRRYALPLVGPLGDDSLFLTA